MNPSITLPHTNTFWNVLGRRNRYQNFSHRSGVFGLYHESAGQLDLLVIVAHKPGTGQFRSFMKACKKAYDIIRVLKVRNESLVGTLIKYGFKCRSTSTSVYPTLIWRAE